MRLLTLALPLIAALMLVVPATAARPPKVQPGFTGTPAFLSVPAADSIHRDVTVTALFTHKGTVTVRFTITFNGVVGDPMTSNTYRGSGSDTFTWLIPGTDCLEPEPGDTVSYELQLIGPKGGVLDEITTDTFHII